MDAHRHAAGVRVRDLDVRGDHERRAGEAHRPDADVIAERRQVGLEPRDGGVGMTAADRPQARRLLAEANARVLGAPDADAHDGRLAGEPALAELHERVDEEALDAADAVGREEHAVVAAEEAALVHGGDVDPVGAGLERVGDFGSMGAHVVVVVDARERVHAVGTQRDRGRRVRGGSPQRPLQRHEAALHLSLVAGAHVIARQACVGAHRAPVGGGDVPVALHLGQHEVRQPVLLALARGGHARAIVGGDVDGRARHQLARGVLDELGGNHDGRKARAMYSGKRASSSATTASPTSRARPGRSPPGSRAHWSR